MSSKLRNKYKSAELLGILGILFRLVCVVVCGLRLWFLWFFCGSIYQYCTRGIQRVLFLVKKKNPKWNISFILSRRSSIFHARCIYTLQDVQSDSYVFLCSSLCIHYLYGSQSTFVIQLMLLT